MSLEKQGLPYPTGIPEKRIVPPAENPVISNEKSKNFAKLFDGYYEDIDTEKRPTILDFHGLPSEAKDEDILAWIEKEMEIPKEYVLEDGKTENSAKFYKQLDYAYHLGMNFLVKTLKYNEKEVSIGPKSLSSQKDIFDLLHKTIFVKGNNKGLSKALLYCRIVKAALVASETLKHDVELLEENTSNFESSLVSKPVGEKRTPLVEMGNKGEEKGFYAIANGEIKGDISFRDKDIMKVMLKFITRAESNAKTALKDGIASRITIDEKQINKLLPILCNWLSDDMEVRYLNIENINMFSEDKLESIRNLLGKHLERDKFNVKNSKLDPTSMGEFETLRITGIIDTKKIGKLADTHEHARQFEIQLVKPFNKNEEGKMHHAVFDVSKLVNARTRLDGACPEHVFMEFVRDASNESGISKNKIIHYLVESKNSPITKMKKKNNKNGESVYIANSVYDRWSEFKWVDDKLMSDINHSRNK